MNNTSSVTQLKKGTAEFKHMPLSGKKKPDSLHWLKEREHFTLLFAFLQA
jgi:hypothetical protein